MTIRALVVDDEPLARQRIDWLLKSEADITLIGECADGAQALEVISRDKPDLVFLDVQMPEMDGFEMLLRLTPELLPVVIFTTAHGQHALRAFEAHALDYLLKPYKADRFKAAVARSRAQLANRRYGDAARDLRAMLEAAGASAAPPAWLKRIAVKTDGHVLMIRTSDVECLESAGNYVCVSAGTQTHVVRETLNALEKQLDPAQFLRINRGIIVNLNHVMAVQSAVQSAAHGGHAVVLRQGRRLPVTRGLKDLEHRLKYA